eukprot:5534098-Amphidinium_carterae.1
MTETETVEVSHERVVKLQNCGSKTWLLHVSTGETLRLPVGTHTHTHTLHFNEEGISAVAHQHADGSQTVDWTNELLTRSLFEIREGGSISYIVKVKDGTARPLQAYETDIVRALLDMGSIQDQIVPVRVFRHTLMPGGVHFYVAISPIVRYVWGGTASQRGFVTKRVVYWEKHLRDLGCE